MASIESFRQIATNENALGRLKLADDGEGGQKVEAKATTKAGRRVGYIGDAIKRASSNVAAKQADHNNAVKHAFSQAIKAEYGDAPTAALREQLGQADGTPLSARKVRSALEQLDKQREATRMLDVVKGQSADAMKVVMSAQSAFIETQLKIFQSSAETAVNAGKIANDPSLEGLNEGKEDAAKEHLETMKTTLSRAQDAYDNLQTLRKDAREVWSLSPETVSTKDKAALDSLSLAMESKIFQLKEQVGLAEEVIVDIRLLEFQDDDSDVRRNRALLYSLQTLNTAFSQVTSAVAVFEANAREAVAQLPDASAPNFQPTQEENAAARVALERLAPMADELSTLEGSVQEAARLLDMTTQDLEQKYVSIVREEEGPIRMDEEGKVLKDRLSPGQLFLVELPQFQSASPKLLKEFADARTRLAKSIEAAEQVMGHAPLFEERRI